MKCVKCDQVATYVSPENYCCEHWADWWVDGLLDGKESDFGYTKKELLEETLKEMKKNYKRKKKDK